MKEQSEFMEAFVRKGKMLDGAYSGDTVLIISLEDAEILAGIGHRLGRCAPYEDKLREWVTGK